MASPVDICNLALSYLGAEPISAIDGTDTSGNAQLCARVYPIAKRNVLEESVWTFATGRGTSDTPSTASPEYGYAFAHDVPQNTLNVVEVTADKKSGKNAPIDLDWRLEGWQILCDAESIAFKYIADVDPADDGTESDQFSNKFVTALAYRIAAELAPTITESNTKTEQMWNLYYKLVQEAKTRDAMQGRGDRLRSSALIRVR